MGHRISRDALKGDIASRLFFSNLNYGANLRWVYKFMNSREKCVFVSVCSGENEYAEFLCTPKKPFV